MQVLTEADLRRTRLKGVKRVEVDSDVFITEAARSYAKEYGMELQRAVDKMAQVKIDMSKDKPFIDSLSGERLAKKPEGMTHLYANVLVPKTDPRIAFRGKLDGLQAQIILIQAECETLKRGRLIDDLTEVLKVLRSIMSADVNNKPLPPLELWQKNEAELRYASHHVEEYFGIKHPTPDYKYGIVFSQLNRLRTQVRETELAAAKAFAGERQDIIETLNRLSSAIYLLMVREVKENG